jgi:hypothetical protein
MSSADSWRYGGWMLEEGETTLVYRRGTWRITREEYFGDYHLWHSRCQDAGCLEWEEVERKRCSECNVGILKDALITYKLLTMGSR